MPSKLSLAPLSFRHCGVSVGAGLLRPHRLALAMAFSFSHVFSTAAAAAAEPPATPSAQPAEPSLPTELDALELADKASAPAAQSAKTSAGTSLRAFVEAGIGRAEFRTGAPDASTRRLSADLRYDQRWTPALRAVLSNRLDLADSNATPPARSVNTLREAYLSWSPAASTVLDFGRVNIPLGSAMGYNPTDWFKSGALRSVVSPDPAVLRENRQGTVVLRGQHLWEGGSLTALASPKLASNPDPGRFALDAGSTNPRNRWLLAGSHRISDRFSPQWLVQGAAGQATQVGLNLSALAGEATTVYAEWASGRGPTLLEQALGAGAVGQRRNRAALGLTHTTRFDLTFSLEAQTNSAAPARAQWQGLSPVERLSLLTVADRERDLISRRAWFAHAQWKGVFVSKLDLAGYWLHDVETGSDDRWLELRYRGQRSETALQWQGFGGGTETILGSVPTTRSIELTLRAYF